MQEIPQCQEERHCFLLKRTAYLRNSLLALLTAGAFLLGSALLSAAALCLWSSYQHTLTPYLKWQDALLALLLYGALMALTGGAMSLRYLYTLQMGYRQQMVVIDENSLTIRDLSHKNLGSIFWMNGTMLLCFLAALGGLTPLMLLGWTLQWPDRTLAALGSGLALLLSLPGLALSLGMLALLICMLLSCFTLARSLGAARTYRLNSHTSLWVHDRMLSILSPGQPESLLELSLLTGSDQLQLLSLLRTRWIAADRPWNPALGEEIAAALAEVEQLALSA